MRLRRLLRINIGLSACLSLAMVLILGLAVQRANRRQDERTNMKEVIEGLFEINLHTQEYILHPLQRIEVQWKANHERVDRLLAPSRGRDDAYRPSLAELRRAFARIGPLFAALVQTRSGPLDAERREALIGKLLAASQAVLSDAQEAWVRKHRETLAMQKIANALFVALVVFAALALAGSSVLMGRLLGGPIEGFREATNVIGAGDLGHKVSIRSFEEIEELADSFNEMTAHLEASRKALEAEVAHRQRAEEELARHAERLEQSNRELQDFAYVASHDLQEPLRKIQAFGAIVKAELGEKLEEEGLDSLERMTGAAARMRALIESLLEYSRVTTRAEPLGPVDLGEVLREVVDDLEARLGQTGGTVEVGNLPVIEADANQMGRLFQNLIANGLKFHREGVPPEVRIYAAREGVNRWRITVEDNGIGFEERYAEKIFSPFQRLHGRETYEGTGMGLTICRRIAERHAGSVAARSVLGRGSRFVVTLPAKQGGGSLA